MNQKSLSKTERLNYILECMRTQRRLSPAMLAQELNISARTLFRDIQDLEKQQAFKITYNRIEGRYQVESRPQLSLMLQPTEALALYIAASNPALADDSFFSTDLHAGLKKIEALLAPSARKAVNALEGHIAVSLQSLTIQTIERPIMEKVYQAIRTDRKMRLRYWSATSNAERALIVHPYDLHFLRHNWYLLAHSEEHREVRTFKVSRIRDADVLEERFKRSRRYSSEAYLANAWEMCGGMEEEIQVQARFAPQVAALVADSRGRQFVRMEHLPDGSLLCTALVNSLKEISWWLLSYGSAVEVLAPPALRLTFTQIAQEMATLYDVSSPPQLYMDTILVAEDTPAPYQPDSQPNGNP